MPNYAVSTPRTVQAAIYGTLDTRELLNSLTFRRLGAEPTVSQAQHLADEVRLYWRTRMVPYLSRDYVHTFVIVIGLSTFPNPIGAGFGAFVPGGYAEPALPNNVGFRVDFHTGAGGRPYRGWSTLSGIPRSQVLRNHVNAIWADAVTNVWGGFAPLANALGWEWVVTSTEVGGGPRAGGIATPITLASYKDLTVDSCRHRLPGRRF